MKKAQRRRLRLRESPKTAVSGGDAFKIGGRTVDTSFDFHVSRPSLNRVRNFHTAVIININKYPGLGLGPDDTIIDFDAYQGMFLYGVSQLWNCHCIAINHSRDDIEFTRSDFGFENSRIPENIYTDAFDTPVSFATTVHSLEHLRKPVSFLENLRNNILKQNGFIYIEVLNLYGTTLCEPTLFFTCTMKSLKFLLERSGFQVLGIFTSDYPEISEFADHNGEQNLIYIAGSKA